MRRLGLAMAALCVLAVSGCAQYLPVDGDGHTTAEPPKLAGSATPSTTPAKGGQCHAAEMQYLVGHNKSEAPPPVNPGNRRVYCSTCTITMDYRPGRLNIVFDKDTGTITAVKCG